MIFKSQEFISFTFYTFGQFLFKTYQKIAQSYNKEKKLVQNQIIQIVQREIIEKQMSLKCTISKVVMTKQYPVFILAQLALKGQSQQKAQSQKFRTELSLSTSRPNFSNNQFIFSLTSQSNNQSNDSDVFSLKFGLMLMPSDIYGKIISEDFNLAKPIALASLNISLKRLRQKGSKPQIKYLQMIDSQRKVHAQFQCMFEYYNRIGNEVQNFQFQKQTGQIFNKKIQNPINNEGLENGEEIVLFDPLINWMVYDQNCQDPLRQKSCIAALQQQLNILFQRYHKSKTEQQQLETLFHELQEDQKQLLTDLEMHQKLNNKISEKLNQKESLDALKLEIQMLRGSKEGKQLLLDKVEYFQDRIWKEQQIYQELLIHYDKIKPQIQKKLQKSQSIAARLKGKEQQELQIQNNIQILQNYEQILYQYNSNQQVIKSLANLSKKSSSQYTRQQAELFLSQVKYQIQLEERNVQRKQKKVDKQEDYQDTLLKMIEDQMKDIKIANSKYENPNEQNRQEQQFVLKIKLESLEQEIEKISAKISKVKDKKTLANQFYQNKSFVSTQ